eukprot:6178563-Pleurochrysis_carterae.AAC.3
MSLNLRLYEVDRWLSESQHATPCALRLRWLASEAVPTVARRGPQPQGLLAASTLVATLHVRRRRRRSARTTRSHSSRDCMLLLAADASPDRGFFECFTERGVMKIPISKLGSASLANANGHLSRSLRAIQPEAQRAVRTARCAPLGDPSRAATPPNTQRARGLRARRHREQHCRHVLLKGPCNPISRARPSSSFSTETHRSLQNHRCDSERVSLSGAESLLTQACYWRLLCHAFVLPPLACA